MNRFTNKGITLIALTITIVVLIIIASITIIEGTQALDKVKLENLVTNMITIKSKAKIYAEEVESKTWDLSKDIKEGATVSEKEQGRQDCLTGDEYNFCLITADNKRIYGMENLLDNEAFYYALEEDALNKMGLNSLWGEDRYYVIKYVVENEKYEVNDIIFTKGIEYQNNMYYSLTQLQGI